MKDLKIISLIDLVNYEEQKIPEFKTKNYQYNHWPISKEIPQIIDFDIINAQIDEILKAGRCLIYCLDG